MAKSQPTKLPELFRHKFTDRASVRVNGKSGYLSQ